MAQIDLPDIMDHEIRKYHCLKPSAFDLRRKRGGQSCPEASSQFSNKDLYYCVQGDENLWGYRGPSWQESCSGLCSMGWWMSDPQNNNRMAESLIMFVVHPVIPSPSGLTQGNLESILRDYYIQPGLESWDLHQQDVYSQPSKWTSFLFPDDKRDSFPLILNLCLQQSRTSPFIFTRESQSLWRLLIWWTIRWIMSKTGFHFPPWAVEDIKISGSFDRSQPCSCLHLIEYS